MTRTLRRLRRRIKRRLIDVGQWLPERWRPMSNAERDRIYAERSAEFRREYAPWLRHNLEGAIYKMLSGRDDKP